MKYDESREKGRSAVSKVKILFLYAEILGYIVSTFRELTRMGVELHVVHWDSRKLTPLTANIVEGATYYPRSETSLRDIQDLVLKNEFALAYVSGWMEKDYLTVAKQLRRDKIPVVCGLDDQWDGSVKQQVAGLLGSARYFHRYFTHAWVAGAPQYHYARRIGFLPNEIVYDLLSADLSLFNPHTTLEAIRGNPYPHRFLYVGRFHQEKGTDILVSAWKMLGSRRRDWELRVIGGGPQAHVFVSQDGVSVREFVDSDALPGEAALAGCFVLPSRRDQWGVVLHEFAAAGLPLICSNVCGAASAFLVPGWNGYCFSSNDPAALAEAMDQIISTEDATLFQMGARSHRLAQRITPETSAANLMSIIRGNGAVSSSPPW